MLLSQKSTTGNLKMNVMKEEDPDTSTQFFKTQKDYLSDLLVHLEESCNALSLSGFNVSIS